ncbi:glutaminase A [Falsibacillus albus]|uniref:Glutaminase n=1 Tax=Falsibacillus albus TaxID=2478915 RepID=A0A3L7JYL8_9BACI|nr:glutaminase A [Falsibacillus albus]RLQ95876.1 glutaminase A [Falsibacillus albus]
MKCLSNEELKRLVEIARPTSKSGKIVDYIPALKNAEQNDLSVSIYYPDGPFYFAGDYLKKFTLQSISKVITLALVLSESGVEAVFSRVGMEPTGDPFNSIVKLESTRPSKPLNPMINAGALAVTNMIKGKDHKERWDRLIHFVRELANDPYISFNREVSDSEYETAHLNRALCYFMKQHSIIEGDVEYLLDVYTKQCAIEMNCSHLARIGAVFAMDGYDFTMGRQIVSKDIARMCKTFMVTCGMYNASGEFAMKVGIPAKSGVSGGIMGAVPQKCGIGIYGPSLDEKGNSVSGLKLLEMMSEKYDWSIF